MNYEQKQWDAALADWQRVVSKHPQTNEASYAQYMIGVVTERELGQPAEALEAYRKVTWGSHAAEAQAAIARLTAKSLTVVTERVFRSHETPAIKLTTRNIPAVTVRVYRINPEAYFRKTHRLDGVEDLDIALIAPDATFEFPIPKYAEHRELESTVPLPQPEMAAGALAVTVGSDTLEATTLVLRSDLDVIVKASPSEVFVLAENMRTGKPWPGVRLLISDGKTILAEAATGDDGVCQRDLPRAGAAQAADRPRTRRNRPVRGRRAAHPRRRQGDGPGAGRGSRRVECGVTRRIERRPSAGGPRLSVHGSASLSGRAAGLRPRLYPQRGARCLPGRSG